MLQKFALGSSFGLEAIQNRSDCGGEPKACSAVPYVWIYSPAGFSC